jgi:hypothetical protein
MMSWHKNIIKDIPVNDKNSCKTGLFYRPVKLLPGHAGKILGHIGYRNDRATINQLYQ